MVRVCGKWEARRVQDVARTYSAGGLRTPLSPEDVVVATANKQLQRSGVNCDGDRSSYRARVLCGGLFVRRNILVEYDGVKATRYDRGI